MTDVAILGASGYTGAELIRLLVPHPAIRIHTLTADRRAGRAPGEVFPQLAPLDLPRLQALEDVVWDDVAAVFCALPHATTQAVIRDLPAHLKIVDLSADFRLRDPAVYAETYGQPHGAPALQEEAVYGLTEFNREEIVAARLVANPGCYPTGALLPLCPLLAAGAIDPTDIIIDSKSGVTGAGRGPKEGTLFTEVSTGLHAYNVNGHRHGPEIDQELSAAAGQPVMAQFTPHLVPMNRGILSTLYVRPRDNDADYLHALLSQRFANEPFVHVLPPGDLPATRHVVGSNQCCIGVTSDRSGTRALIVSALDNLMKGASGAAVQNMNLMLGLPETMGLDQVPVFP